MGTSPTAAVIIIGNEILSGKTIDQNIPFLAKELDNLGIALNHVHIIGDIAEIIIHTVRQCHQTATYVFTTGGIGPTHDDITAQAIADTFNCPLELNATALKALQTHYGEENMNPGRQRMALIPRGANLIYNPVSAAPGFYLKNVFVMAGVPDIARAMFDEIRSLLMPGPKIFTKTIKTTVGESLIAIELAAIQDRYPRINIGSYPHFRNKTFGLSLVLRGTDEEDIAQAADEIIALVKEKGGVPTIEATL